MNNEVKVLSDSLSEYLNEIEKYVPADWILQFGKWKSFRDEIENLVGEWEESLEDRDKMEK